MNKQPKENEIGENEIDEFEWLDILNYQTGNYFKQPEYLSSNWIYVIFSSIDYYRQFSPWVLLGKTEGKDTFVIHRLNIGEIQMDSLKELFHLAEAHQIKRLIFSNCSFDLIIDRVLSTSIREVVLNECKFVRNIFLTIFNYHSKSTEYNFRKLILRKSNDIATDFRPIRGYLSAMNYIRELKLIKCNYLVLGVEKYNKLSLEGYQEERKQVDLIIAKNNRGYYKCKKICLVFLSNRIRKTSPLYVHQDRQLINIIVKLIWNTKYQDRWYDE